MMIKNLSRDIFCSSLSLYILNQIGFGIRYNSWATLILAGLVLSLLNIFLRPLFSLLTLPINLVSFGLFSIFVDLGLLYAVTRLVRGFAITSFSLSGVGFWGYAVPPLFFDGLPAFFFVTLSLKLLVTILKKFVF